MHRIFGQKEAFNYFRREGAYLIPVENDNVALVRTSKGLFLIGGGVEPDETHVQAILRECLEETGCSAIPGSFVCSAETYTFHPKFGYFHPVQSYYLGKISKPLRSPLEADHALVWLSIADARGKLYLEMQNWALEMCLKKLNTTTEVQI